MTRVKIEKPGKPHFTCDYTIHVGDLNYGNHLGNDKVLTIAQDARIKMFAKYGMSELYFGDASLIQGDAAIIYKSEGHLHDELEIFVTVEDVGRCNFDLIYEIKNKTTGNDLALVKTGMVCYDYTEKKVVACPEEWARQFI